MTKLFQIKIKHQNKVVIGKVLLQNFMHKKVKPPCKRIQKKFKMLDLYGKSVQLTYKGQETYKSVVGASVSFVILSVLLGFFIYKVIILQTKSDTKLAKKSFFLDLDSDSTPEVDIGESGFDFAFGLRDQLEAKYGNFQLNQVQIYFDPNTKQGTKTKSPIEFKQCQDQYFNFPNQDKVKLYGIDKYLFNQYFDFNNYTNPVQKFIDDSQFFELEYGRWKASNIYIQANKAQIQDEILSFSDKTLNFFSVKILMNLTQIQSTQFREYQDAQDLDDSNIAVYYFRLDNSYDIYERRVYGLFDLLGDVGGFKESLLMIGMLLVGFIQDKLLLSSLLKHIYQVDYKSENQEEQDLNRKLSSELQSPVKINQTVKIEQTTEQDTTQCLENKSPKLRRKELKLQRFNKKQQVKQKAQYYQDNASCLSNEEKDGMINMIFSRIRFKYLKLLIQVFLNENQKMLMKFQRKMVLDSESSSSDSDRNDQDTIKLFESKNYIIRAMVRNKVRQSFSELTGKKEIKKIDKRLLKGIFLKRLKNTSKIQNLNGFQTLIQSRTSNLDSYHNESISHHNSINDTLHNDMSLLRPLRLLLEPGRNEISPMSMTSALKDNSPTDFFKVKQFKHQTTKLEKIYKASSFDLSPKTYHISLDDNKVESYKIMINNISAKRFSSEKFITPVSEAQEDLQDSSFEHQRCNMNSKLTQRGFEDGQQMQFAFQESTPPQQNNHNKKMQKLQYLENTIDKLYYEYERNLNNESQDNMLQNNQSYKRKSSKKINYDMNL
eukprot:403365294